MSKHTKGPWIWKRGRTQQHLHAESQRGNFGNISMPIPNSERYRADAALIAAAPDLYELLTEAENLAVLGDIGEDTVTYGWGDWLKRTRAALRAHSAEAPHGNR